MYLSTASSDSVGCWPIFSRTRPTPSGARSQTGGSRDRRRRASFCRSGGDDPLDRDGMPTCGSRGDIELDAALTEHEISREEYIAWERLYDEAGLPALRSTYLAEHRTGRVVRVPARPPLRPPGFFLRRLAALRAR
jgi:hypothetical protein